MQVSCSKVDAYCLICLSKLVAARKGEPLSNVWYSSKGNFDQCC